MDENVINGFRVVKKRSNAIFCVRDARSELV